MTKQVPRQDKRQFSKGTESPVAENWPAKLGFQVLFQLEAEIFATLKYGSIILGHSLAPSYHPEMTGILFNS